MTYYIVYLYYSVQYTSTISEKVYDIYLPENDHRHITQSHLPKEHRLLYRFYHNPINHSSSLVPILIFMLVC